MPRLFRVVYEYIGEINEDQLEQLSAALEEEEDEDQDYFVNAETLEYLADKVEPAVLDMLRTAVGDEDGVEIYWESDEEELA